MKFAKALISGFGAATFLALASPVWAQGDYYDEKDDGDESGSADSDDEYDSNSSDSGSASAEASGSASLSSGSLSGTLNQEGSSEGSGGKVPAMDGASDHSRFIGTFGVGYMGYRTMGLGVDQDNPDNIVGVEAPVIGLRYWLNGDMGFDVGLGLVLASRSTEVDGNNTDDPQPFGFILHGGVPLALSSSQHFVFEITPELNVGFASNTVEVGGEDLDESGFHLDIGARAGGEIHFGFIDVPELALQAGIGLRYAMDSTTAEIDSDNTASASSSRFETTVGDNPWSIFTANIAALYYFGR